MLNFLSQSGVHSNIQAEEAFRKALLASPSCTSCWVDLAKEYESLYLRKEVPKHLYELPIQDVNEPSIFLGRGTALTETANYDEALTDLNKAIELDQTLGYAFSVRGQLYGSLRQYNEALADFDRAMTINPNAADFFIARAEIHRAMEDYHNALADLNVAIELDPDSARAFYRRGLIHNEMAHYKEAKDDFEECLRLDDSYEQIAKVQLSKVYRNQSNFERAAEFAHRALMLNVKNLSSWQSLAVAYSRLYPPQKALKLIKDISIKYGNDSAVLTNLAAALLQLDSYEEALTYINKAIEINPNNAFAITVRGDIFYHLHQYEEALFEFNKAIELEPLESHTFYSRALLYTKTEHFKEAIADLNRAIQIDYSFDHRANKQIGRILIRQREYSEAVGYLQQALISTPDCRETWRLLTIAYSAFNVRQDIPQFLKSVPIGNIAENNPELVKEITVTRIDGLAEAGFYEEALELLDDFLPANASVIEGSTHSRALLLSAVGRYADAIEVYEKESLEDPENVSPLYNKAVAMARWKGIQEAQSSIKQARSHLQKLLNTDKHFVALYGIGGLEALIENNEQALDYLKQAASIRDIAINWATVDPAWRDLRNDPKFQSILEED